MKLLLNLISAVIVLITYSSMNGQDKDGRGTTSACDDLLKRSREASQEKNYKTAAGLLEQWLAECNPGSFRASGLYNLACYSSLLREPEKAFGYLHQCIEAGYTDAALMSADPDLSGLKKDFPGKFQACLDELKKSFDRARVEQSPIAVTMFDDYIGPADASAYIWDDYNAPQMDTLRTRYHLADIVRDGKTEFEKMKLMLAWASSRFTHHNSNTCKGRNALAILAEAEKGAQFSCTDYSRLLANCLDALGYPARIVGLTWLGSGFGNPDAHICTEVWSNQFQKWILLDGQNNAWWEHNGIPLSAVECRNLQIGGRDSEMVFAGQNREFDYSAQKPYWASHFYHLEMGNQYSFFGPPRRIGVKYYQLIAEGMIPELYSRGVPDSPELSDDEREAYPQLNQTAISLLHPDESSRSDTLRIVLRHSMPWFAGFRVRLNGADWKETGASFLWALRPGENTIEAKAVNSAGIEGKTSRIVLRNNIGGKR